MGEHTHFWRELSVGLSILNCIPFMVMIMGIAILPLSAKRHWWEDNKNKLVFSTCLAVPVLLYFIFYLGQWLEVIDILLDYFAFIALLAALFVISGGIYITGRLGGTPGLNCVLFLIGGVIANFLGTTGASMLLIRPLIRANRDRKFVVHTIIFFIFIVANIGGCLTPLGDPPLFIGFLRGVPFEWTLLLFPQWAFTVLVVIAIYFLIDSAIYSKEAPQKILTETVKIPFGIKGWHNFFFLAVVLMVVFFCGKIHGGLCERLNIHHFFCKNHLEKPLQGILLLLIALISYSVTSKAIRRLNEFTFEPIKEVAYLFFGIFMTLLPVKLILFARGPEFPMDKPWHFFWLTGSLSSFLDNTPTYLVFFEILRGAGRIPEIIRFEPYIFLVAISCGAVFFGAMTYIGNGPNFMIKAIAHEHRIKMPEFLGFMFKYSLPILIPIFIIATLIFFRA